jgi:hypothetical protein
MLLLEILCDNNNYFIFNKGILMPPALEKKGLKENWSFLKTVKQIIKVVTQLKFSRKKIKGTKK